MNNRKFKCRLFTMLITISIIPLILSITIICAASLYITKSNLEKEAKDTLFIVARNLSSYCKENEINTLNAGDYYDYLDSLKEQNIEMAIILEGVSCATSIKNENDYRIREIEFKKDIIADKEELEKGYYDEHVVIDDKVYFAYYFPIKTDDEITGMAFAGKLKDNVIGSIKNSVIVYIYTAVLLIMLFAVIDLIFSRGLLKSFRAAGRNINALSRGYLSGQEEHVSSVKEMNTLIQETGLMQKNLSETIGKVKDVSQMLVENITEVTELSESSAGRAKQIIFSVDDLAASAMGMAENVQNINTQMLEIGNCVNDISRNVDYLYNSSENILQTNEEAKKNMDTIMENSIMSVNAVNEITVQIKETNESIEEIHKAVELILSISDETKLLSLNASIEAARAGEHGKGFAIVAEEIRSLSEQSARGAEMIKNLAEIITEKSHNSVKLSDKVYSFILLEQESASNTQRKVEELSQDICQSVNEIRSIAEKTENLADYKEKVVENVQDLSAISEENAASNEEVNANIYEIITEVQRVNENCRKINELARKLDGAVSYFHD